jgi:hypothetical protein
MLIISAESASMDIKVSGVKKKRFRGREKT